MSSSPSDKSAPIIPIARAATGGATKRNDRRFLLISANLSLLIGDASSFFCSKMNLVVPTAIRTPQKRSAVEFPLKSRAKSSSAPRATTVIRRRAFPNLESLALFTAFDALSKRLIVPVPIVPTVAITTAPTRKKRSSCLLLGTEYETMARSRGSERRDSRHNFLPRAVANVNCSRS